MEAIDRPNQSLHGGPRTTRTVPGSASHGDRIGPYRILRLVGEGGMGEVFEALQESPVRRRVALKLIKPGMDTREVVARFESERQALALMNHPNIARVFDGGATDRGYPYFVMEYVQGDAITEYCDRQQLSLEGRIRLFLSVCEAIHHAHQKGIIHRDIKPSNVLVSVENGQPVPKVIDFGVAKATTQRLTERSLVTEIGQFIGTPSYMSPEQAEMTALDVDTRSDVYSLGVLLYEILAGALPFERTELMAHGPANLPQQIREMDVPRPSTRLRNLGADRRRIARNRRTDAETLGHHLMRDLDWIILKALEKDRTRRYGSVLELSAELERYLRHEVVLARPPSLPYRVRKFVRRHRIGVVTGAVVALAFVLGSVGTLVGWMRAVRAEREARVEAETARSVSEFLVGLFESADPWGSREDTTLSVRQVLDRGANRVRRELVSQPGVQARLMATMGRTYSQLGLRSEAESLLHQAVRTAEATYGPDHPEVARSLRDLGAHQDWYGKEYARTAAHLERALAIHERTLGPQDVETGRTVYALATAMASGGDDERALELLSRARRIFLDAGEAYEREVAWCLNDMGMIHYNRKDYEQSERYFGEALSLKQKVLGAEHPDVGMGLNNLAYPVAAKGRHEEAERLLTQALEIEEAALGPGNRSTLFIRQTLGELMTTMERYEEAEVVLLDCLAQAEAAVGHESSFVGFVLHSLGVLHQRTGEFERSRKELTESLRLQEALLAPGRPEILTTRRTLAATLRSLGRNEEADRVERGTQGSVAPASNIP